MEEPITSARTILVLRILVIFAVVTLPYILQGCSVSSPSPVIAIDAPLTCSSTQIELLMLRNDVTTLARCK